MELIVRNLGGEFQETIVGERLYHTNFKPIFTSPHRGQSDIAPLPLRHFDSDPFDFKASVSGIESKISGQWQDNKLNYSIGSYAEVELELAPVSLATLTIHDSVHTLHANQLQNEVLLGVGGILDHSYHQMPSLHASAVEYKGEAILFIGESNQGKSTLARELNGMHGIFSLSDDICLVDGTKAELISNTPQLKVQHYYYPAARNTPRYPIKAIFILTDAKDSVYALALDKTTALIKLMRHTACARVMPKQLTAHLLPLYGNNLANLPFFELHYPRTMDVFPKVANEMIQAIA